MNKLTLLQESRSPKQSSNMDHKLRIVFWWNDEANKQVPMEFSGQSHKIMEVSLASS